MRRVVLLSLLLAGCYQSHRAAGARSDAGARRDAGRPVRRDAGSPRRDAGPPRRDAGPVATCDESKLRTSGLVEGWGRGSRCDFVVVCSDGTSAWPAVRAGFPDAMCREETDFACGGEGSASCLQSVGALSDAQYDAACALTLRGDVRAVVCAGDL